MKFLSLSFTWLITISVALRIAFFIFGLYQDENKLVKYTDIDYVVFSDAANYVSQGLSPYKRETYRYTPLLAWLLVPTAWGGLFVHFGKILFMICDILTGILISRTLPSSLCEQRRNLLLAFWLLNPMVITISTRGSSESVLTCLIMLSVYYYLRDRYNILAIWLGLSIHFKIYPIIYITAFLYSLSAKSSPIGFFRQMPIVKWITNDNLKFLLMTLLSLGLCNYAMYQCYGYEFLDHSYLYHLTRIDHRHNFSVYNVMLYYASARPYLPVKQTSYLDCALSLVADSIETFAFWPQLLLSAVILPLILAQQNLISCFFVQTFAFVTFNKVITSQYFIWFLIFLPSYVATSSLATKKNVPRAIAMLLMWVVGQIYWLFYAYKLEFLGESTFSDGLLLSSIFFFLTNCYLLKLFIEYA